MDLLTEFGFSSVFVIPDHLLRVHNFVASYYLNPSRGDVGEDELTPDMMVDVLDAQVHDDDHNRTAANVQFDRPRRFVVEDHPTLGPGAFFAKKTVGASAATAVGQKKLM